MKWERRGGRTTVRLERLEIANADVAGDVTGTYRTLANGPGEIDMVARASRGDARQIHRYLPRAIDPATRDWLRTRSWAARPPKRASRSPATSPSFLPERKGGKLLLDTKAKAVTLAYADGWPPIDAIDASVRIEGTHLTVDAARGRVHGVEVGRTRVEISDLALDHPLLRVGGEERDRLRASSVT